MTDPLRDALDKFRSLVATQDLPLSLPEREGVVRGMQTPDVFVGRLEEDPQFRATLTGLLDSETIVAAMPPRSYALLRAVVEGSARQAGAGTVYVAGARPGIPPEFDPFGENAGVIEGKKPGVKYSIFSYLMDISGLPPEKRDPAKRYLGLLRAASRAASAGVFFADDGVRAYADAAWLAMRHGWYLHAIYPALQSGSPTLPRKAILEYALKADAAPSVVDRNVLKFALWLSKEDTIWLKDELLKRDRIATAAKVAFLVPDKDISSYPHQDNCLAETAESYRLFGAAEDRLISELNVHGLAALYTDIMWWVFNDSLEFANRDSKNRPGFMASDRKKMFGERLFACLKKMDSLLKRLGPMTGPNERVPAAAFYERAGQILSGTAEDDEAMSPRERRDAAQAAYRGAAHIYESHVKWAELARARNGLARFYVKNGDPANATGAFIKIAAALEMWDRMLPQQPLPMMGSENTESLFKNAPKDEGAQSVIDARAAVFRHAEAYFAALEFAQLGDDEQKFRTIEAAYFKVVKELGQRVGGPETRRVLGKINRLLKLDTTEGSLNDAKEWLKWRNTRPSPLPLFTLTERAKEQRAAWRSGEEEPPWEDDSDFLKQRRMPDYLNRLFAGYKTLLELYSPEDSPVLNMLISHLIGRVVLFGDAPELVNARIVLDVFEKAKDKKNAEAFALIALNLPHEDNHGAWGVYGMTVEFLAAALGKTSDTIEAGLLKLVMEPDSYLLAGYLAHARLFFDFAEEKTQGRELLKSIVDLSLERRGEFEFCRVMSGVLKMMRENYLARTQWWSGGINLRTHVTAPFNDAHPFSPAAKFLAPLMNLVGLLGNSETYEEGLREAAKYAGMNPRPRAPEKPGTPQGPGVPPTGMAGGAGNFPAGTLPGAGSGIIARGIGDNTVLISSSWEAGTTVISGRAAVGEGAAIMARQAAGNSVFFPTVAMAQPNMGLAGMPWFAPLFAPPVVARPFVFPR